MKRIIVFEHLVPRQIFPGTLLGPSSRHLKKIQKGELKDISPGIYVEVFDPNPAQIEGTLNGFDLIFHNVLGAPSLYYAPIPETALNPYFNDVELTISGRGYSQQELYTFSARYEDVIVLAEINSDKAKAEEIKEFIIHRQMIVVNIQTDSGQRDITFKPHLLYRDTATNRTYCYGYAMDGTNPVSLRLDLISKIDGYNKKFDIVSDWKDHPTFKTLKSQNHFAQEWIIE